ncbi:MAG TPA: IS3 family transposase [Candidatus Aveggerthella excrementigallinarum]|nr:IS3 family transposase [Candidatus Aveggerthella excrementigallinarum]
MLDKLELPKSTYYRYAGGRSPRADRWADVRPLVREAFARTPNGVGYRQVAMALRTEQGLSISGKTVLKLMREEGLRCRILRKRYDSYRGERGKAAENVLDRSFAAEAPMTKLATDVTEFKVAEAKAYLSPVMDLYNNEIVAWSAARSPNFAQTLEMLDGLGPRLEGPALLHSDSKNAVSRFCGRATKPVSCKPGPHRSTLTRTPIEGPNASAA